MILFHRFLQRLLSPTPEGLRETLTSSTPLVISHSCSREALNTSFVKRYLARHRAKLEETKAMPSHPVSVHLVTDIKVIAQHVFMVFEARPTNRIPSIQPLQLGVLADLALTNLLTETLSVKPFGRAIRARLRKWIFRAVSSSTTSTFVLITLRQCDIRPALISPHDLDAFRPGCFLFPAFIHSLIRQFLLFLLFTLSRYCLILTRFCIDRLSLTLYVGRSQCCRTPPIITDLHTLRRAALGSGHSRDRI